ncbi:MAG: HD family hydrolase [Rhodospirillales bacterium]|nr:HD family hydrolase [Rhodospirillales bacterium]
MTSRTSTGRTPNARVPASRPAAARAWVRLPSGRRLDLLDPTPFDWTDEDLAIGLARTYRWGGHSAWPLPLSVAQHSLLVLALRRQGSGTGLSDAFARRELLHDADEGLLGFDPISPLKPFLGEGYAAVAARLGAAIAGRYAVPAWTAEEKRAHKRADRIAAASEAMHVVGWTRTEIRQTLRITEAPVDFDPLAGEPPWAPWPADLAAERFLAALRRLMPPA